MNLAYSNDEIAVMLKEIISLLKTENRQGSNESLGSFLKEWYKLYVRPGITAETAVNYRMYIYDRIIPALGAIPLNELTPGDLQSYFISIPNGNTRKKQLFLLKRAIRKAIALGKLTRNPFEATEIPTYHKKSYRALEFDEQNTILKHIERRPYYHAVFTLLCCTGLRIGEFLALDLNKDVDLKENVIHISKTVDIHTNEIKNRTKTYAGTRTVPILPELHPYIQTLRETPVPPYSAVRSYFRRVYKRFEIKRANQHSMRHTFISLCHIANIQPKYVQYIVGHRDIEMTLNIYTHVMKKGTSPLLDYVRKLGEYLNNNYV